MSNNNLLFDKKVRNKKKSWYNSFIFRPYYESEKITLKEKIYTFYYNLEKTGYTTKGESDWSLRMVSLDYKIWDTIEKEFKKDFIDFELNK